MDLRDVWVAHRVACKGDAKVVRCATEHILKLCCNLIVNTVQAQVEMLELRATLQEPICGLVSIGIPHDFAFELVQHGDRFLGLLLLL